MHDLIHTATTELPALGAGWNENVVDRLSFQQQRTVEERGIARLEQLDLAALLRVLDRNWYELSQICRAFAFEFFCFPISAFCSLKASTTQTEAGKQPIYLVLSMVSPIPGAATLRGMIFTKCL